MTIRTPFLASLFLLASLAACGGDAPEPAPATSALPESFHLAAEPGGVRPVADVLASAEDGDQVAVVGRVGGSARPFVDGAAAFSLVDPVAIPCGEDGMTCKTPWDYSCADLAGRVVNVELVDADGRLVAEDVRGFHGLDHLDTVVVEGEVAKDEAGNVRLLASGLHVRP
jgi:hypothetical protein